MATVYDRARPRSETTLRAEHLLSLYPNLSERDLAELINLFPHVNMVSRGLMAADDRMGSKVEHFYRDHGAKLGSVGGGRTTLIALAALVVIIIGMSLT
ncbi:hypothetical protein [Sphingosinicella rhizophila]|uniref:Uncharacterized protein n=1 Tax=Sphingosinicella rhizophila TaxID=3050082 RepID=A0ABU3QCE2_9SPHN|nr:hypothetical protein [Sphingosinicella sp. GR2756]MDT9601065.1 hypothetical protein [Sphingosinicella sp. GR2756]